MKKIIAILLALAVVSTMAFADGSVTNTVSTKPMVYIGGWNGAWPYWQFNPVLEEKISGSYTTEDGRAGISGNVSIKLNWVEKVANSNILSFSPRWKFSKVAPSFSGWFKPIDNLKLTVYGGGSVAGPGIQWVSCDFWPEYASIASPSSTSNGLGGLIGAEYSLLDGNLKLMANLGNTASWNTNEAVWIKKGAYGPFAFGINFKVSDAVSVGAHWNGQFGGYNPDATSPDGGKSIGDTDKKYQKHGFYVGADLNFWQDAEKVGTKLGVGFSFDTEKESKIMDKPKNTMFAGTVKAEFDFHNSITDTIWATVGWRNNNGKRTRVLPFSIQNTLGYKVSDGASFSLETGYVQGGMSLRKKDYDNGAYIGEKEADGVIKALNSVDWYACTIHIKPSFSFSINKHSFSFGVETDVFNRMKHWNKTDRDWAYTTMQSLCAKVSMPISWSYTF